MPNFQKIDEVKAQYNKNLFPADFLNNNTHAWTANLTPGGALQTITVESQTEIKYAEEGIRILCTGASESDSFFAPTNPTHYAFSVEKEGRYIFSFAAFSNHEDTYPVEIEGSLNIYEVVSGISPPNLYDLQFQIGNNTTPEFSFQYKKWEIFFIELELEATIEYRMEWNIFQNPSSSFNIYDLTLDLFKLEYMDDKKWQVPSYYTKPGV